MGNLLFQQVLRKPLQTEKHQRLLHLPYIHKNHAREEFLYVLKPNLLAHLV
jgi:hypothetical protein